MENLIEEFSSLAEAGEYARVGRQAIFVAIKKGQLRAEKRMMRGKRGRLQMQWIVTRKDLDEYRQSKYSREKRMYDGEKLFDIENNKWSVLHASKTLSAMLGEPYPTAHLYYLLRTGKLRAAKRGNAWVIAREDLLTLYTQAASYGTSQLKFV